MLFSAVMFREAILLGVSHETAYHNVHFTANRSFPFATVEQTVSIKNRIYSLVCIVCCLNTYHAEYKIAVSPQPFSGQNTGLASQNATIQSFILTNF